MPRTLLALVLLPVLFLSACVTTTATTTSWGDGGGEWQRPGYVEAVHETTVRREGNPAGGAVAGALIGGLLGSALGGHTVYDRWGRAYYQGSAAGAAAGAVGGAVVGAAASSQPPTEDRFWDVTIRYDDGAAETYRYRTPFPFRVGEGVILTPRGLARR